MIVFHTVTEDPAIEAVRSRLGASNTPLAIHGLWGSSAPISAAALAEKLSRPVLYVTAHLEEADNARDDLETVLGRAADLLPAWETLPGEGAGASEIGEERARLCGVLKAEAARGEVGESARIIVAPIQALMQAAPSPASLEANTLAMAVGEQRAPETIAVWLTERGFERLDQVEQPGDFALRGGILDIFASSDSDPIRLEFFGDEIESIRRFEVGTQRSVRELKSASITRSPDPAKAKPRDTTSFLNYLPKETVIVLFEPLEIVEISRTILNRLGRPEGHYPFEAISKRMGAFAQLHLSRFPLATVSEKDAFGVSCEALPAFDAKATDAVGQLIGMAEEHKVVVYCDNQGERERLAELLAQTQEAEPPAIESRIGVVHEGFIWRPAKGAADAEEPSARQALAVVPHHQLFHRYTQRRRIRKVAASRPIDSFLELEEGDLVVHVVHGIAKFVGMKTMQKGRSNKREEFLSLRFADAATMHVPASQIDLVHKYVGAGGARPALSKVGGTRWQSMKDRVVEAVNDLAADLLSVQAARETQSGIAYPQDTHWQAEFENAFLYTETPDQTSAMRAIKSDQVRAQPMDRLVCGDVGYGKTELAMRAVFKVVEFGKQVAVLVPTTILAEQHYRTFKERMADYPFLVACLNRFRSGKEQREIIAAAKKGHVDVLIGTHRILSKDVDFSDLGLVIVDEEQRFGVEHKERLKRLRSTVDVMTLTATPIPRTLHMAMVGARDISSLATPPMDRRSISTRVCHWSDDVIREALVRELNRDGQVFFVHNRVHSIKGIAARLADLVPDARIVIGHGQMSGDELEEVMMRFVQHEADILVSTTIIESGLDIPNANTIFIDHADRFGLADMHQLRGRVGRYKHRAYCYLLLHPDRPLTSTAARRLKAIEEYSDLGAGFRIAMRDLEIRGAGNILGAEQSGHIAAVGYELYCQLLEKTVKRMRGETFQERLDVHLELDTEAYIPRAYIASDRQRMECYRRFAVCRTAEDVERLTADLVDAFGPQPETVDTLLALAEIRVRAGRFGMKTIIKKVPDLIFQFDGEVRKIEPLFHGVKGRVSLPDGRTLHWRPPDEYFHGNTLLAILRNLFRRGDGQGSTETNAPSRRPVRSSPQPANGPPLAASAAAPKAPSPRKRLGRDRQGRPNKPQ